MPGSSDKGKLQIIDWFHNLPKKRLILDVGPGWGTYSKLLRGKNQIWHAIEIHKPYIKRFKLEKYYDKIFVADVKNFTPKNRYDVAICGDVLEHIANKEAIEVLKKLFKKISYIIVSLPLDAETNAPPGTGDIDWGNPYELHVGKWSHHLFIDTIKKLGRPILAMKKFPEIGIYLIGPEKGKSFINKSESITKKYKIVGICKVYNELEKGNLKRFLRYILPLVDDLVIYDDGSTDGSYEYVLRYTPHVIRSAKNDFAGEVNHRNLMLKKALKLKPDFILQLDADEVISAGAKEKLQELCKHCEKKKLDAIAFHKINIWRSATWKRIDSLYDANWTPQLWRVTSRLGFGEIKRGLHQSALIPSSIQKKEQTDKLAVLHFGFADKLNLVYKYLIYRSHGQRGYKLLDRLINEEKLKLERIPKEMFPKGLWKKDDKKPKPMSLTESLAYVEKYKEQVFRPKYSIACLIYKSVDWLKFIYEQVLKYTDMTDKEFYFIANDANKDVIKFLKDNYIPHYIFNNTEKQRKEWYINNVYRAWNYAAEVAKGDFIVFINSDMAFAPGWFENLISAYNGENCISSRLVESGKLKSGTYGIEKNFGHSYSSYKEREFQQYAASISENTIKDGGLYMPLLIRKQHFIEVGGYPEGNVKPGSNIFHPKIAQKGDKLISGDTILMEKLKTIGAHHQTAFNSVVYHFQCGEMDEKNLGTRHKEKIQIAICNDLVTGTLGEKVLWDHLLENLSGAYGVDKRKVDQEGNFEQKAKRYIDKNYPKTSIIIQNATFMDSIDEGRYTIVFLQDDLRSMGQESAQQEANLRIANKIVANSIQTVLSYSDFNCEVIPIGADSKTFKPMNKKELRKKHGFGSGKIGIFVGNFSEVKGWSKIKQCIKNHPEITWILVSKYEEKYKAKNVRVYNKIDQKLLAELLNCADFFIIGSPVETLCLAAVEACLCNIPVVMPKVGVFKGFSDEDREKLGIFGDDLGAGVKNVFKRKFNPRDLILKKGLTTQVSMKKWKKLLQDIILEINIQKIRREDKAVKQSSKILYLKYKLDFYYRKKILKPLFGKEELTIKQYFSNEFGALIGSIKSLVYQILLKTGLLKIIKKIARRHER